MECLHSRRLSQEMVTHLGERRTIIGQVDDICKVSETLANTQHVPPKQMLPVLSLGVLPGLEQDSWDYVESSFLYVLCPFVIIHLSGQVSCRKIVKQII